MKKKVKPEQAKDAMTVVADVGYEKEDKDDEEVANDGDSKKIVKTVVGNDSFLDAFYDLSATVGTDRANAALVLVQQTVLSWNVKDGAYAWTRLFNGLCSGRAGARQGCASALATFLKLSTTTDAHNNNNQSFLQAILTELHTSTETSSLTEMGLSERIREELLLKTTPDTKKRGIEERDYSFGRLFGILAVVRSGTLLSLDGCNVISGYASDLITLYHYKNWMREPAVYAMMELLSSVPNNDGSVVNQVVPDVFVPFIKKDEDGLTAEQLALGIYIQTTFNNNNKAPTTFFTNELLDLEKNSALCSTLRDTSSVVHPRCHVVWSVLWCFLTREDSNVQTIRDSLPGSTISPALLVTKLVQHVIVENLLGGDDIEDGSKKGMTHERRALALSLVQQLCGASSLNIRLPTQILEEVILQPLVVEKLFLQTVNKGRPSSSEHMLKSLALHVLQSIVDAAKSSKDRRLAVVLALIKANSTFDRVTSTNSTSQLLSLDDETTMDNQLWKEYLAFLEAGVLSDTSHRYIDLVYHFAKQVLRVDTDLVKKVLVFFMAGAFFDSSGLTQPKKKKKNVHPILEEAIRFKSAHIPYAARVTMSLRFHSLITDLASAPSKMMASAMKNRTLSALNVLSFAHNGWECLEKHKATTFFELSNSSETKEAVKEMNNLVEKYVEEGDEKPTTAIARAIAGIASLVKLLHLQLLRPGDSKDTKMNDDDDDDDDDDVQEMISDLTEIAKGFTTLADGQILDEKNQDDKENKANLLASLADVCVRVLTTRGNSAKARGAAKLTRDCGKMAWVGGLIVAASSSDVSEPLLDVNVMTILLESVCGADALGEKHGEEDNVEEGDDDSDQNDDEDDDDDVFTAVTAANLDLDDKNDRSVSNEEDDEEDIVLDPSTLESILVEDSDEDGDILEHHAGADAALVQLLKMKRETRKAGKNEIERLDISNRLRCLMLLEVTFSTSQTAILSNQVVLMTISPILHARRILEKSIIALDDGGKNNAAKGGLSEKRALLDRMSSLFLTKICKTRLDASVEIHRCKELAQVVLTEAMRCASASHLLACSSALLLIMKAVDSENAIALARDIYSAAVKEWSTKKSTKLTAFLFENLIQRNPSIAIESLAESLVEAAKNARSPYLKSEAFRLLSQLYAVTEVDKISKNSALINASTGLAEAIGLALQDEQLLKAKRVRDVLKASEKLVAFAAASASNNNNLWSTLDGLSIHFRSLSESSTSVGLKNTCNNIVKAISNGGNKKEDAGSTLETNPEEPDELPVDRTAGIEMTASRKKKKKKKQGKT